MSDDINKKEDTETKTDEPIVEDVASDTAVVSDVKEDVKKLPDFRSGDTVRVHYKIIEGNKQRIQPFEGIVIAKKGAGVSATFTVRKIAADTIGVERIFPLFSPNIESLEVIKLGAARKSKLYYLRDKTGRAAMRIKERK